ncbi:hypothetical protein, partial [Emticicia fontis]
MKRIFILTLIFTICQKVSAQSTTVLPGLVLPQMTTAQRTALNSPANGTLIFDTNTQSYWYRQSDTWLELPKATYWQLSGGAGNEIKNTNTGGFWSSNPVGLDLYASNTTNPPTAPVEGAGTRLMWIPDRSAFRAGTVTDTNGATWSAANIGLFSFATGIDNQASGYYSVSAGALNKATDYATVAFGFATEASNVAAFAVGNSTKASGPSSIASGYFTTASAFASTAMGYSTTASGLAASAMGYQTTASGDYSTALGSKVNTSNQKGAFLIGDSDPLNKGTTTIGTPDQFVSRFSNGYYLMTSGDTDRTGAQMWGGESAWSAISDSTRKERIVLADGEAFLIKLRGLRLGSWNYKKQGAHPQRFYGPMAQEIFTAFGKDKY